MANVNRSVHNHNNNSLHGSTQRTDGYGYAGGVPGVPSPRQQAHQYPPPAAQQQGYPQHQNPPPQQAPVQFQQQQQQQQQQGQQQRQQPQQQRQQPQPGSGGKSGRMSDQRAKSVLREAVDAVVNSFAKHTQGYGRGK